MTDTTTVTVRLDRKMRDRLEALARGTRRSKSFLAAEAIGAYVEAHEWQVAEIERGVKEADAGGPFVEHDKVDAWLRSWGTDSERSPPWK